MTFSITKTSSQSMTPDASLANKVREQVDIDFSQRVDTLSKLVRIPGIAWEAFDEADLARSAEAVAELFRNSGVFKSVEIKSSVVDGKPGAPAVLASRPAKNGRDRKSVV
jgi:hypothetical protein